MDIWKTVVVAVAAVIAGMYWKGDNSPPSSIVSETTDSEYEYVVVGGGTAGCVLAARLAEDPNNTVLLLEAGVSPEGMFIFEAPLAYNQTWGREFEWDYRTVPRTDIYKGLANNQGLIFKGKVLGGSGIMGMMEHSRGSSFDFNRWEEELGCSGWGSEEVFPYFAKLEDTRCASKWNSQGIRAKGGPIVIDEANLTPMSDIFLHAGFDMGYKIIDTNGDHAIGFDRYQYTVRDGVRSSTASEYLFRKGKRENLHVSTGSFAERIDIQNKRAVGVFFIRNAKRHYVRARKEILLSAGVFNSPQLLMLSGIGPRKHLEQTGIKVVADLPVGDNLHDHVSIYLLSKVQERSTVTEEMIEGFVGQYGYKYFKTGPWAHPGTEGNALLHFEKSNPESAPDIQLQLKPALETQRENQINCNHTFCEEYMYQHADDIGITMVVNLLHPKSRGTVRLSSKDPYDLPTVDLNQLSVKQDIADLIKGVRLWEKFTQTDMMKEVGIDISPTKISFCSDQEYNSEEYWECFIRHFAFPTHNTVGTCKMGAANDTSAVVDPELKVKGIGALRVVDASVFPAVTSGGTNAPTTMLAEKAADMIKGIVPD